MIDQYLQNINKPETNDQLVSLRRFAIDNDIPIITLEGMRFINQIITIKGVKRVLEIGTAIGYSAISMATNNDVHVTTIERDTSMLEHAKRNIKNSHLDNFISIIEEDALDVDETDIEPVDLIFIDAAKAQSINFFNKYKSRLTKRGIIVTDNLLFHGLVTKDNLSKNLTALVRKIDDFNRFVVEQEDFDTVLYAIGDGMSLSIKRM